MTEQANTWGIDDLDGLTSTIVAITIGPWDVMVGGGPDRFIITATTDAGQRVANALSGAPASAEEDTVELTVGGQTVDYPSEYALSLEVRLTQRSRISGHRISLRIVGKCSVNERRGRLSRGRWL